MNRRRTAKSERAAAWVWSMLPFAIALLAALAGCGGTDRTAPPVDPAANAEAGERFRREQAKQAGSLPKNDAESGASEDSAS